ncbi:MAG: ribose 5-phosphate isomerase B [candidate division WOR-3 bacterium]|nr:MAG: ribose 5-phosphate isomerase B [candidate division WOR-3 bacterium]
MKIGIGADHRGIKLKSAIKKYLEGKYHVKDYGAHSAESVDYPDIALELAKDVAAGRLKYGILLCYTGQGMVMAANKVRGIRAAVCTTKRIAVYARAHNNANVLVIPAGFIRSKERAQQVIKTFLSTPFEGGRHLRRINKIKKYENSTRRV